MPTMTSHYIPNYAYYPYFQEQYQTSYFDTKAMLAEEAEKLYNLIAKDLLDETVSDYPVNNRFSPYLPQLPASDKDFPPNEGVSEVHDTV
jgi:hypothetical protein